jgi:hypothetical protein
METLGAGPGIGLLSNLELVGFSGLCALSALLIQPRSGSPQTNILLDFARSELKVKDVHNILEPVLEQSSIQESIQRVIPIL